MCNTANTYSQEMGGNASALGSETTQQRDAYRLQDLVAKARKVTEVLLKGGRVLSRTLRLKAAEFFEMAQQMMQLQPDENDFQLFEAGFGEMYKLASALQTAYDEIVIVHTNTTMATFAVR